jgi:hypothetical protein
MTGSTIFHLHFKATGEDHYFGSIAAIYETFIPVEMGIAQHSLYDYKITAKRPYKNKKVVIKKGELKRKSGGRKLPKGL